jgi:hypothetical protein
MARKFSLKEEKTVPNIQETIWKLASFGELDGIIHWVDQGKNIDGQDERGFSPLCWAARNGHQQVLTYLIENKCSLETPTFGGLRPLHHACNKNNEKIVRMLIAAGVFVNAIDDNGDTAIHYASSRGVLNIVVALIEGGAAIGTSNGQGVTPMHKAAIFGQLAVIKRLIETKADVNCADLQVNMYTYIHKYVLYIYICIYTRRCINVYICVCDIYTYRYMNTYLFIKYHLNT